MSRYMRSDLNRDLEEINESAKARGKVTHLEAQGRNGYTGLDEYNGDRCIRVVQCGSPRECLSAAQSWLTD